MGRADYSAHGKYALYKLVYMWRGHKGWDFRTDEHPKSGAHRFVSEAQKWWDCLRNCNIVIQSCSILNKSFWYKFPPSFQPQNIMRTKLDAVLWVKSTDWRAGDILGDSNENEDFIVFLFGKRKCVYYFQLVNISDCAVGVLYLVLRDSSKISW